MKLGLDVMGGDFAPDCTIEGAIKALESLGPDDAIVLLGPEPVIRQKLGENRVNDDRLVICHQPQTIEMCEKPLKALMEKPDSGLAAGFRLLAAGEIDGFASAGNSGAVLAGAVTSVKNIPGILRPCTCAWVPQEDTGKYSLLLDIGTNPDAKPDVMVQFAIMGSLYARMVMGYEDPRVCLMNVGAEDGKGNQQCQTVFAMLKECSHIHFLGNMEPRDMFKNKAEVFVCDGFVGNIILKQVETFYRLVQKRGWKDPLFDNMNYEIHGGSPILGVNAPVVLGHGISSAKAIANMLLQTKRMCDHNLTEAFRKLFSTYVNPTENL